MRTIHYLSVASMALAMTVMTSACGDDDETVITPPTETVDPAQTQFVVFSGDPTTDLTGGICMKAYTDMTANRTGESVYGAADAVKCPDSFTQETYNSESGVFTGFIYARGASAEGIGASQAGLRSYKLTGGTLQEIAAPVKLSNFGNTGTFGAYSYAAQISQPVVMRVDANGAGQEITLDVAQLAIDEVNPAIANIVDLGNNRVAIVLTYEGIDKAFVAFADYDLKISKVISTDAIGTSVGAQRSVRYTQSGTDDEGNLYVFCGSSAEGGKVGAVRVKKGETEFDASYKFDLLTASGGYRFRKVFHISGDDFLVELYNDKDAYGNMDASGNMAVVNMSDKSYKAVTGLPDPTTVSISWGEGFQGNYYLPIAAVTSFGGGGGQGGGRPSASALPAAFRAATVTPTIYKIDAATGVATPFMTFVSGDLLKGIRIVK